MASPSMKKKRVKNISEVSPGINSFFPKYIVARPLYKLSNLNMCKKCTASGK